MATTTTSLPRKIVSSYGAAAKPTSGGFETFSWYFLRISGVVLIFLVSICPQDVVALTGAADTQMVVVAGDNQVGVLQFGIRTAQQSDNVEQFDRLNGGRGDVCGERGLLHGPRLRSRLLDGEDALGVGRGQRRHHTEARPRRHHRRAADDRFDEERDGRWRGFVDCREATEDAITGNGIAVGGALIVARSLHR